MVVEARLRMGATRAAQTHLLEQGLKKTEIAVRVGVSRRVIYHWIESGQLDRDVDALPPRRVRRQGPTKLDPYKPISEARLATYPELSAARLLEAICVRATPTGWRNWRSSCVRCGRGRRRSPWSALRHRRDIRRRWTSPPSAFRGGGAMRCSCSALLAAPLGAVLSAPDYADRDARGDRRGRSPTRRQAARESRVPSARRALGLPDSRLSRLSREHEGQGRAAGGLHARQFRLRPGVSGRWQSQCAGPGVARRDGERAVHGTTEEAPRVRFERDERPCSTPSPRNPITRWSWPRSTSREAPQSARSRRPLGRLSLWSAAPSPCTHTPSGTRPMKGATL